MAKIKLATKFDAPKKAKKAFRNTEHAPLEKALATRDKMLRKATGRIDDIKGISFDRKEIDALDEFIEYYDGGEADIDSMDDTARQILELAKAIDENGDEVKMIPDAKYDRILNIYLRHGHDEPLPKAIATGGIETISTGYEKLANNLDKSYTVYEDDEIPFGVSSGNPSVEEFLKKAYKVAEYDKGHKIAVKITPKIDGVSINGTVKNGKFFNVSTRGDNGEGLHVKGLDGFEISADASIVDAGEFGAQFEAFVTYNTAGVIESTEGIEYTSNRSAASGIINRATNPKKDSSRLIRHLNLYPIEVEGVEFDSDGEKQSFLDAMSTYGDMEKASVIKGNLKSLLKEIQETFDKYSQMRSSLEYTIDGIVITILDEGMIRELGRKGRKNKYQIALKFDPSRETGEIDTVDLSAGKKGYRTLMARLRKPVQIDGVDYRNIQIKTIEEFEKLDLHTGDKIVVTRGGDVIPKIDKIEESGDGATIDLPTKCPHCERKLIEKSKKLYCKNEHCIGNLTGGIVGFFEALEIKGIGWATATELTKRFCTIDLLLEGLIENPHIVSSCIPGGDKIIKETLKALKKLDAVTAIVAVGAEGIGPGKAAKILEEVAFSEILRCDTEEKTVEIVKRLKTVSGLGKSVDELFRNLLEERASLEALGKFVTSDGSINKDAIRVGHTGLGPDETENLKDLLEGRENYRIVEGKAFDILVTKSYESDSGQLAPPENKDLSKHERIPPL